ncbi:LutC/YkgG family protein [Xanthocytophaga agilis]|uniref:LUD domain-containing protein n=1 Tax=Xanthocytophaga agilis TaxID=3048010 RepID=A0AAE3RCP7_9BACT|nr:LUD domain-containing protein [Xanthocytophaga agilis]MDJ1506035.1 LUD domain-containing protein [Xanthocytophaga agilis]
MNSRELILKKVRQNKPDLLPLPILEAYPQGDIDLTDKFGTFLKNVGGDIYLAKDVQEARAHLTQKFQLSESIKVADYTDTNLLKQDPHSFEDVFVTIMRGQWGVAENAAIWIPEEYLPGKQRVLPFICQHLVIYLPSDALVPTMYEAYQKIGTQNFGGYGVFIAGPSKTADIEQSLVIGAHGPRSLTVYLIEKQQL